MLYSVSEKRTVTTKKRAGFRLMVEELEERSLPALSSLQAMTLNGDYVAAGVGLQGRTTANINVAGIPAGSTTTAAYLYWGFEFGTQPASLGTLDLNGTSLTGTYLGSGPGTLGVAANSYAFRADVTSLVAGNGTYTLTNLATGGPTGLGASVVVIFSNPAMASRTVIITDGNDVIRAASLTNTLSGFTAPARVNARTSFVVGGSQGVADRTTFTGSLGTLTWTNNFNASDGSAWDTDTFDVSSVVAAGDTSVTTSFILVNDWLNWVAQVFSIGPANVRVTPSLGSTNVTEGGATDTFDVALDNQPSSNVVLLVAADAQLNVGPSLLTFTPANWNVPQTVTVSAVDDLIFEANHTGVVSMTAASADASYNGITIASITASITDNDFPAAITLVQSAGATSVAESGAGDSYTMVLANAPTADVFLTLTPDSQVSAVPNVLTFTPANWNLAQTVAVAAVDDRRAEGTHTGVIAHTVSSADIRYGVMTVPSLTASITDNDTVGVNVLASGGSTDVTEGGITDAYTVVLNSQPTGDVVVAFSPGAQLALSAASLTFTPAMWNVPQTVTVTALDDSIASGTRTGTISHSAASSDAGYQGLSVATLTATITDNDVPALIITPTGGSTTVVEAGGGDSYSVVLATQPTSNVIVAVSPDSQVTVSATRLTFTPTDWNVAQSITLAAVDDQIAEGAHAGVIGHSVTSADAAYQALAPVRVTAGVADNDVAGLLITQTGGSTEISEDGAGDTFSLVLTSQPTASVFVTLTGDSQASVSTTSLVFTPSTWNLPQAVAASAIDDFLAEGPHVGVIAASTTSGDASYNALGGAVTAGITDNDNPGLLVTLAGPRLMLLEGGTAQSYTLALRSPPLADVVVALAPDSTLSVSPATVTFTPANWNIPRPITVNALDDALSQGPHAAMINHSTVSADVAYNGLPATAVAAQIADNEGEVIIGTSRADSIIVQPSADGRVQVSVNSTVSYLPGSVPQILIQGGDGSDNIQILAPTVPVIVMGGTGTDRLFVTGQASANTFTLTGVALDVNGVGVSSWGVENLVVNGRAGNDTFDVVQLPSFSTEFKGDLGNDRVSGPDIVNRWKITGKNLGTLGVIVKLNGIENWQGGSAADTFSFASGQSLDGQIDGAAGSNVLDLSAYTSSVTINLQTSVSTGSRDFQNIDAVLGGRGSDRLIAPDQDNLWNITTTNGGTVAGVTFRNVENLTGGQRDDTFVFANNQSIKGKIDGAAGIDGLDFSSYLARAVTVNLQTKTATGTGGFANLEHITGGGSLVDTLIGANQVNVWNLSGVGVGMLGSLAFDAFENLTGGNSSDTFALGAAGDWLGLLNGGAGIDMLDTQIRGNGLWSGTSSNGTLNGRRFGSIEKRL